MPTNITDFLDYGALGLLALTLVSLIFICIKFTSTMQDIVKGASDERAQFWGNFDLRLLEQSFMLKQTGESLIRLITDNDKAHEKQMNIHERQIELLDNIQRKLKGTI